MFTMAASSVHGLEVADSKPPSIRHPHPQSLLHSTPERRKSSSDMRIEELKALHRESSVQEIKSKFDRGSSSVPETRESFQEKLRKMSQADRAMMRAMYFHSDRNKLIKGKFSSMDSEKISLVESQRTWDLGRKAAIIEEWSKSALFETSATSLTRFDAEQSLSHYGITEATAGAEHWAVWLQAIDQVMHSLQDKTKGAVPPVGINVSSPLKLVEDLSTEHCQIMMRDYSPVVGMGSAPGSPNKTHPSAMHSSLSSFSTNLFKTSTSGKPEHSEKNGTKSAIPTEEEGEQVDSSFDDHTEGAGGDESDNEVDGDASEEIVVESYHDDIWKTRSLSGCAEREDVLNLATPDKEEADTLPSCNPSTIVSPASSFSPLVFPRSPSGSECGIADKHALIPVSMSPSGVGSDGSYSLVNPPPSSCPPSPTSPTGSRVVHVVSAEEDAHLDIAIALSERKEQRKGPQTTLLLPPPLPETALVSDSDSTGLLSAGTESMPARCSSPGQKSLIWSSITLVGCFLVLLSLTLYATLYPRTGSVSKHIMTVSKPSIPAPKTREVSTDFKEEIVTSATVEELGNSLLASLESVNKEGGGLVGTDKASLVAYSYEDIVPTNCPSPIIEVKMINVCNSPSAMTLKSFRSAIGKLKSFLMSVLSTIVKPFRRQ